jgi:hypothetical protein
MYIYNFLLRITDTATSQNIDVPSWDTLYIRVYPLSLKRRVMGKNCKSKKPPWRDNPTEAVDLAAWVRVQANLFLHYFHLDEAIGIVARI